MDQSATPVLCGGTFFAILLQYRTLPNSSRNHTKGMTDKFTESDVLTALLAIILPADKISIVKSVCSDYKKCSKSLNALVGGDDRALQVINAFDDRVKSHYNEALKSMEDFVDTHIIYDMNLRIGFIKALLDLICQDASIHDTDAFFTSKNGQHIKKLAQSATSLNVYLPALLLGIWHFAVTNREDNTIGEATFISLHKQNAQKHTRRHYSGKLGIDYKCNINVLSERPSGIDGVTQQFIDKIEENSLENIDADDGIVPQATESTIDGNALDTTIYPEPAIASPSVPEKCRICVCCRDWTGNFQRAIRRSDGIYGDCDALGARVLSNGTCEKFRANFNRVIQYQLFSGLPNSGTIFSK